MTKNLVIVGGARTAMAEYVGTPGYGLFKKLSALELGAIAAKGAFERSGVSPEQIDHVVMGNALQTSADALYGARHVGLKAGIPIETPALTVNRLCGSGIQSVVDAAQQILCGDSEVVLAGGMESMSQAPHVIRGAREGMRFGMPPQIEDSLFASLMDTHCGFYMAQTAENLAKEYGVSREEQDEFALRSHQLGAAAVKNGLFADEIVPVTVKKGRSEVVVDTDDHIKPGTTLEGLSKLRAAFGKEGTVTAGNASGIVDGAAALIITTEERAIAESWPLLAKIRSWGISGVKPETMGFGPVPSIQSACEKGGVAVSDVDYFEINEAFSAQYLACEKALGLNRDQCNVNGGAVAIGHPLGATGTRLLLTLCHQLERGDKSLGMASACIGGGQGIAMLIERG
ncbi:MAG TPA: acetyl-CoA C-acetyltransferase [Planctomycetota bacterium]|jgi:acetyl-CoA acetyltransferase family protein|nr:acetyl-CoA C-acyltransferase [Planctomycetota bacterium]MDP7245229.1 acetyl-CoA C-acetyltransferase [Planctomycetota bacterium]HJM39050.1 acetyl-CoA C-acetyltransferase [Planctomycetota bacterium]|tara:strand:- start:18903 stop:20102 length:1200 start_codon:yes stop_codon:yes gene_type:complete